LQNIDGEKDDDDTDTRTKTRTRKQTFGVSALQSQSVIEDRQERLRGLNQNQALAYCTVPSAHRKRRRHARILIIILYHLLDPSLGLCRHSIRRRTRTRLDYFRPGSVDIATGLKSLVA
jgi:hypothetical protein